MTSWHSDEPISEAFWFAEHCAIHPNVELLETIILHISGESRCLAMLQTYRDSQTATDEA
jgi:hypothetical protein